MTDINPWFPEPDPVLHQALGKLLEEVNELGAIAARCLIQGYHEEEPVTHKLNRVALREEMADVEAAMAWLREIIVEPGGRSPRHVRKLNGFRAWQKMIEASQPSTHSGGNRSSESISGEEGPRSKPIEGALAAAEEHEPVEARQDAIWHDLTFIIADFLHLRDEALEPGEADEEERQASAEHLVTSLRSAITTLKHKDKGK